MLETMQAHWERNLEGTASLGLVEEPLSRFAESDHYLPLLHKEIGIINKVITQLDDFIKEHVESLTDEEVQACNT